MNLQTRGSRDFAALARSIEAWLAAQLGSPHVRLVGLRHVVGSGSANETLTASLESGGRASEVVLRIVSSGMRPYLDARLDRQAAIIRWAKANTAAPIPDIIAVDAAGDAFGEPFMVMARIEGQAPSDYPGYNASGFLCEMRSEKRRTLWRSAVDTLALLHRADVGTIDFLDFPGVPGAALPHLLAHWKNSYDWAGDDLPRAYFDDVVAWLTRAAPSHAPRGLSWGDARIGNMLFKDSRCVAVLDWEMASCAGPLVDLAWWLLFDRIQDEDLGLKRLEGLGSRQETLDRWSAATGHSLDTMHWHEALALFQLSVTRAKSFGDRRRAGLPYPGEDDPRSVRRLQRRLDALLGR